MPSGALHIVYCQRLRLPGFHAHAVHTALTAVAFAGAGASVSLLPAAPLRGGRRIARDFFAQLGLDDLPQGLALRVIPTRHKGLYGLLFRAGLWRLLRRQGPTLCWASSVREAAMALTLRPRGPQRPPVIFEIHHIISRLKTGREARQLRALEARVFAQADMVVFNCETLRREAESCLPRPRRTLVSPIGYNEHAIRAARSPDLPEPSEQTGEVRLAYVGSLQAGKGIDNLLRALALLPENHSLIVIGDGKPHWRAKLAELAREEGLAGRVTFTGRVAQRGLAPLLADRDVFVIPISTEEDFFAPIKMYEALGFGMPIVAAPTASLREGLREGENALFARGAAPRALAEAIKTLGEKPDLRRAMRRANLARAAGLTTARRARDLLDVFTREFRGEPD